MKTTAALYAGWNRLEKRRLGRFLGPVFALTILWLCGESLEPSARIVAAIAGLMMVFWVTEALPLSVTALIPIALFPLLDVAPADQATAPYAKPVIFLFLGGFMMALAVERSGLHQRVAITMVRTFGARADCVVAGCMAATAFLSMWISNTATTVMMIPIVTSLLELLPDDQTSCRSSASRLNTCLLLGVAYAANVGGFATLVGTPPNALLAGFLRDRGLEIGFGSWMIVAFPVVVVLLLLTWLVLTRLSLDADTRRLKLSQQQIDARLMKLGKVSQAEWTVIAVFLVTVSLWVLREPLASWDYLIERHPWITRLDDASIAVAAAVSLFMLPAGKENGERILDWQVTSKLPWGVLLLIGGGMSLASAMQWTGLNDIVAGKLEGVMVLPTPLVLLAVAGLVIFTTEVVSNTATTAAVLPVLFGLGSQFDKGPLLLVIPATIAASCAFMFPVSTPPNAVVFGSGRVPMRAMMKYGLCLNVAGMILIPLIVYFSASFLFQ